MNIILMIGLFICFGLFNIEVAAIDCSAKLAEIKVGKLDEAQASWWGFDASDSTKCLQAAIDSGVKKLTVDCTGKDWIIGPVKLRSGLELVFADGVVVRAKSGLFKAPGDCLFVAKDAKNLFIRGDGTATLEMNKKDYQNTAQYRFSEWRHCISLRGCENVTIKNLTLKNSGGDGIYVSASKNMRGCKNIVIEKVIADGHHRQGISIISAENLLVKDSKFNNTSGTGPAAGVDLEPNHQDEWLINNVFENCDFEGNHAAGVLLHLSPLTARTKPISVTFRNCRIINNGGGIQIYASKTSAVGGIVIFENCNISGASKRNILNIINQQSDGLKIMIKNCVFDHSGSEEPDFLFNSDIAQDISNVNFDNVTLIPGKAQALRFSGMTGCGILSLTGRLNIKDKSGTESIYSLDKFVEANKPNQELKNFSAKALDLKKLCPVSETSKTAETNIRLRGRFDLLQYTGQAGEFPLTFLIHKINKFPINANVTVKDFNGTTVDKFKITQAEHTYILKSNGRNLFTLEIDTKGQLISLKNSHPGQCITAASRVHILGGNQRFYFNVPDGVKEIKLEVYTPPKEPVSAKLLDAQGNTVDSVENLEGCHQFRFNRKDASKAETWSIHFTKAREDVFFRLGAPLLPVVAVAPENLLIEK